MPQMVYMRDGRAPIPKSEAISRVMSANRGKNTLPELKLRKALGTEGLRGHRLHPKKVPSRPDIVYTKKKIAIFVNGCFWHRCPFCKLPLPKTNRVFWRNKFQKNIVRDKKNVSLLKKDGWRVVVIWECQLKNNIENPTKKIKRLYQN